MAEDVNLPLLAIVNAGRASAIFLDGARVGLAAPRGGDYWSVAVKSGIRLDAGKHTPAVHSSATLTSAFIADFPPPNSVRRYKLPHKHRTETSYGRQFTRSCRITDSNAETIKMDRDNFADTRESLFAVGQSVLGQALR